MKIHLRAVAPKSAPQVCLGRVRELSLTERIARSAAGIFSLLLFLLSAGHNISAQHYQQTNLVSDVPNLAEFTDPDLVNPWGLISTGSSPWWVSDNGTGLSTLYNGAGVKNQGLIVTVATPTPPPSPTPTPATPTGVVNNGTTDFDLVMGMASTAARFIFVTEDGTISGWNPSVNSNHSVLKVNNPGSAVYKGVTIAQVGGVNYLYVADFFNGRVAIFDKNYAPATTFAADAFTDPNLPDGFAPFNIQNIGGDIFVAWAKQDDQRHDEVAGRGLGYVDEFDPSGTLLMRFEHVPWLNAPWGLALAPTADAASPGFGKSSGMLLVGMFGSGQIATFDPASGDFEGLLRDRHGKAITIDGLWALRFGNGGNAGPTNTLFFTAGIDDEAHGLFGTITALPNGKGDDDQ
jgi:uncharacterized protein (TIGR03118 family)